MTERPTYRLGDLQLRIMRILWKAGECTVSDVHNELGVAEFAYSTIATMLRKMEARGLVEHREEQRRFLYKASVPEADVTRTAVDDLVDRVFAGSLSDAVNHLLQSRDVSPEELSQLERLIRERKKRS